MLNTYILRQFLLKLHMQIKCSIKESTTSASCTILVKGSLGSIYDSLVACESCICIRTEHEYVVTFHHHLCSLLSRNLPEERINTCLHKFLRLTIILVSFL